MNKAVSVFILADVIKVNYTDSFVFICIAEISPVFWRLLHYFTKVHLDIIRAINYDQ